MTQPPPSHPNAHVLVIEENPELLSRLCLDLRTAGYCHIRPSKSAGMGLTALKSRNYEVVLFGLPPGDIHGEELLAKITEARPEAHVLVMAEKPNLESMTAFWRIGAKDFLRKPVDITRLLSALENTLYVKMLEKENLALKEGLFEEKIKNPMAFKDIITHHHRMKAIFIYMEAIAKTPYPILITGESGTGKELIAKCLHALGECQGVFVAVNVAGLDDTLFSDVLFGHAKGAYTGAEQERMGMLRKAENGILFLDEIGDIDKKSQLKLLRLLQEREFQPLGSDKTHKTNARIIIATNADLESKMEIGEFRQDLFYRLNTHSIHLPPLRERMSDIPHLVQHFVSVHCQMMGLPLLSYSDKFLNILHQHHFPGNVRELENVVADAVARSEGKKILSLKTLKRTEKQQDTAKEGLSLPFPNLHDKTFSSLPSLEEVEQEYIASVLQFTHQNLTAASEILGIGYSTLHRKLKNSPTNPKNKA